METWAEKLENSLTLGPPAIGGQYDGDLRRIGERYAQGDGITREKLKDIIINLQMVILMNLRAAKVDGVPLDLETLQLASDRNRVNAVMALCHLYERMASTAPVPGEVGHLHTGRSTPDISSLSSLSPASSISRHRHASMTSSITSHSDVLSDHSNDRLSIDSSADAPNTTFDKGKRLSCANPSAKRLLFLPRRRSSTSVPRNNEQRSSQCTTPMQTTNHRTSINGPTEGYVGPTGFSLSARYRPGAPSRTNSVTWPIDTIHRRTGKGFFSPDELYSHWNLPSDNENETVTTELNRILEDSTAQPSKGLVHTDWGTPLKDEDSRPPSPILMIQACMSSSIISRSSSNPSGYGRIPSPFTPSMRLYIPCEENNYAGFCKGAWRLQLGLKKAFTLRSRAEGLKLTSTYSWRCSKCNFEGPAVNASTSITNERYSSSSLSSRTYDMTIRTHPATGIRYRWSFLAKSHIFIKKIQLIHPQGSDGTIGVFGCIFCCAQQRGPAPTFGNLDTFMEHLHKQHRDIEPSPQMEILLDRARCVLGRVADTTEDFDVNIPPSSRG